MVGPLADAKFISLESNKSFKVDIDFHLPYHASDKVNMILRKSSDTYVKVIQCMHIKVSQHSSSQSSTSSNGSG